MIDEKKLINFIDAGKFRNPDELCFSENDVVRLIKNFTELSNELGLNEQPKTDWIPCEERLPSEAGFYLVTVKREGKLEVFCLYYKKEYWLCDQVEIGKIIAWTDLPQPYKKEGGTDAEP